MRWFGGCAPRGPRIAPTGADVISTTPLLWTAGKWTPRHMRITTGRGVGVVVFGPCSADDGDLTHALTALDFARTAGAWAGSFTALRYGYGDVVEVIADPSGACPLYTVNTPDGLLWASSARALSSLVGGQVDTEWLASYLWDKKAPVPGRSAWAGVAPVAAGHQLLLSDATAQCSPWWEPTTRRREAALPAIRHALTEGVRARVAGRPSSTDLAGMDSTTLAVIAAQYGSITAVTTHPTGVLTDSGDLHYAQTLNVTGLNRTLFPLETRHLPFTPADEPLPASDEPPPSTAVWAMLSDQLRFTAHKGIACHLTGDGGDNLFLPSPTHLVDLARHRRWLRMTKDALDWARLRRVSPLPLITAALHGDTQRVARPWLARPAWLIADMPAPARPAGGADEALITSIRTVARAAHADTQLADSLGVELNNPYFDGNVLDAVVSVPPWDRFSARRYKPLLVDACRDLLPEAHRTRAAKGMFVQDFHRGLRANLPRLLDLADGHLAARGLIDPAPLRKTLQAAALGANTVWPALLPAVAAETWLRTVQSAPATTWTTPARAGIR
ncbi:albusnodin/ikarugamycin family macrolactam cyclase [Streptomyces sp. TS71-3]|uniref:albusnodin/ikarugamycin family macrolactam cyclase n=1 Tax=Streptomyces sp. TS71-3 TaxID=2733862 RepID=UPI001B09D09F|nr:albusnodin/ikarugamycin family macrolactam cyclase [Streptomyces sp. TS71-3]GHJ34468.1 asparagine synthetase B [Streptomyces sp. TS71-3]